MSPQSLAKTFTSRAIGGALLLVLVGCVGHPFPPDVAISEVPIATSPAANISIIRKNHWGAAFNRLYISLDGVTIVRLIDGQYTTFPVSEGWHEVLIYTYQADAAPLPFLVGVAVFDWRRVGLHGIGRKFEANQNYYFTVAWYTPGPWAALVKGEEARLIVEQIEQPVGEFELEHHTYVPPGPPKPE